MVVFEISINGQPHCEGEDVTTVTIVAEQLARGERVSIHAQAAGDENLQWLAANLAAGDEILIRIVDTTQLPDPGPHGCSFCGREIHDFKKLVHGREVAICDTCISGFAAVGQTGAKPPTLATRVDRLANRRLSRDRVKTSGEELRRTLFARY